MRDVAVNIFYIISITIGVMCVSVGVLNHFANPIVITDCISDQINDVPPETAEKILSSCPSRQADVEVHTSECIHKYLNSYYRGVRYRFIIKCR